MPKRGPDLRDFFTVVKKDSPKNKRCRIDLDEELSQCVEMVEHFVDDPSDVYDKLMEELNLKQETITLQGKVHLQPRLTSVHADDVTRSGRSKVDPRWNTTVHPMTPTLILLQKHIEKEMGLRLDFVVANFYRDGHDRIGPHADKPYGQPAADNMDIVSLSFGSERTFRMKHVDDGRLVFDRKLKSGSMLWMKGRCQQLYKHEVPREVKVLGGRLNLTFRNYVY
ncbi:DNA repair system specific for alkylated DNA [Planoprotostelium fungivorum]|uniref:DNA repair system specific for alkylated DNA n=1 Tax=Planoprotostelium fungivorum TaxID=1890364 RepID=A0A2P6MYI5_9EUKA|nr:DNA repair system specific for alkylated DNA [Planoprotostelium fungivorum]